MTVVPRVALLDYATSNLRSVAKALESLGAAVTVAAEPVDPSTFDAVILPGVGNFGDAMRRIRGRGLDATAAAAAGGGVPLFGICLGLQLLFDESEESPGVAGLGILPGAVRRIVTPRKLPHIGWSHVAWTAGTPLAPVGGGTAAAATYYFLHSYACAPEDERLVLGRADHGVPFCAAAGRGEVMGVQFHPEKSSAAGLGLLGRWLDGLRVTRDVAAA